MSTRRGSLVIVSAPSGTGKTTLVERLVETVPDMVMSRSYTSRPVRSGETDGVDYNFVDRPRFDAMVESEAFLEWATVFGHRYGTSAEDTERHRREGKDVVLVIDVQGASQVRARGIGSISIFVLPPSFDVLEDRLRRRSENDVSEEVLERRLTTARSEVDARDAYDYIVVNEELDTCLDQLRCIVISERLRLAAMRDQADQVASTFTP
jgi:guanylate kinase